MCLRLTEGERLEEILRAGGGGGRRELEAGVAALRGWLEGQSHLPHSAGDGMLAGFVAGSKSLELAKQRLDAYYTARTLTPAIYANRDPLSDTLMAVKDTVEACWLPEPGPEGERVVVLKTAEGGRLDHGALATWFHVLLDLRLHLDSPTPSLVFVWDARHFTTSTLARINPLLLRQSIRCTESVYPIKIKASIVINMNQFAETLINKVIKPFLKPKLAQRLHVYSADHSVLQDHLPLDILPRDYGGSAPTVSQLHDSWVEKAKEYREWLLTEGSETSDESRRPPASASSDGGLQGTFRRLDID